MNPKAMSLIEEIYKSFDHDFIKYYLCSSDADAGVGDATYALIRKKGNQQIK